MDEAIHLKTLPYAPFDTSLRPELHNMTSSHLTNGMQAHIPPPTPRRSASPLIGDMARPTPAVVLDSGNAIQPDDAKRESEWQASFQHEANNVLKVPNGYMKVALLIIRWDKKIDEFDGHDEEVSPNIGRKLYQLTRSRSQGSEEYSKTDSAIIAMKPVLKTFEILKLI